MNRLAALMIIILLSILSGCSGSANQPIVETSNASSETSAPSTIPIETKAVDSTSQYDENLLNLWVEKYEQGVEDFLTYINDDGEIVSESEVGLLKNILKDYIDEDCILWDSLMANVGAWNYNRGSSPLFDEGGQGYTIDYEIQEVSGNTVKIKTTEHIKATVDSINIGDPLEETVNCSYTLEMRDGEYICIEADATPFFQLIESYGYPMVVMTAEEIEEENNPQYWSLVSFQASTPIPKFSLVKNSFEIKNSLYGSDVMAAIKTTKLNKSYEAGENVELEFDYYLSGNLWGTNIAQGIVTSKTDNSMTISATYTVGQSSAVNIQAVYNAVY